MDRKVSRVMCPYVKEVLRRDCIPYTVTKTDEGYLFDIPLKNKEFTVVLEDALCEKQRDKTMCRIPVYSLRTYKNKKKFERLRKLNGKKGFRILNQDLMAYQKIAQHAVMS